MLKIPNYWIKSELFKDFYKAQTKLYIEICHLVIYGLIIKNKVYIFLCRTNKFKDTIKQHKYF